MATSSIGRQAVGSQAVVVGAGIGGLAAAGALAPHFEQVVVVERDALPAEPVDRAGIPQGPHAHGLLVSGQRALSELFPDFEQDLVRAGAVPLIAGYDVRMERPGYESFPRRDLGWCTYALSRPAIEHVARRRVEAFANVSFRQRCRVHEVLATADGATVTGVRCENGTGSTEALDADLVVDASGRGALTLALLKSTGRPLPEETTIGVDFGYATCVFAIPDDAPTDWKGVMTLGGQGPQGARGGLLFPLEGNRWMVSLGGRHGDRPPGDTEGYMAFARGLRTPTIYDAIKQARNLGGVVRYGFPESMLRHFERLATFPRGLLPIADAICRFNPVYGQGMSVAALEACLLGRLLESPTDRGDPIAGLASAFFAEVPALIETPWAVATFDFMHPETRGQRPADFEMRLKFGMALTRLAAEDPDVHRLTGEVQNLLKPRSVYRDDPVLLKRILETMAQT